MNNFKSSVVCKVIGAALLAILAASTAFALEIVTEEDFVQGIIVEDQLVKVAENAVFLLDTSSSMNEEFRDTGKTKRDLVESAFKKRNSYFPDIGTKFAIYAYTPWQEFYAMQPYDRAKVAAALDAVSEISIGPTPMKRALEEVEKLLPSLSGRTAVFVFSDGEYTGSDPRKVAQRIATNHDVCFYVISTATVALNNTLGNTVASLNACSRMIPLEYYLNRPEYQSGALFDVVATAEVVTLVETRTEVRVDNILFGFDKSELNEKDRAELDELGEFMSANPNSYAVIAGYTDSTGPEDYNEGLSQRRTEMVAGYLSDQHGVTEDRVVLHWYGSDNPLVSNDTREGRAQNRRVEVALGGV